MPVFEAEDNTPVAGNVDRPESFKIAFEPMQPKTGQIHVLNFNGLLQSGEDPLDLGDVFLLYFPPVPLLEEQPETFVVKALDHL
jgi:hypothetical protein